MVIKGFMGNDNFCFVEVMQHSHIKFIKGLFPGQGRKQPKFEAAILQKKDSTIWGVKKDRFATDKRQNTT